VGGKMRKIIDVFNRLLKIKKNRNQIKEKKIFKYNEDDILEIITEYLASENGFETFGTKAILLGTANKDLRVVVVISEFEDDSVNAMDLEQMDNEMNFNGSH
jgi:hypothetical protein